MVHFSSRLQILITINEGKYGKKKAATANKISIGAIIVSSIIALGALVVRIIAFYK